MTNPLEWLQTNLGLRADPTAWPAQYSYRPGRDGGNEPVAHKLPSAPVVPDPYDDLDEEDYEDEPSMPPVYTHKRTIPTLLFAFIPLAVMVVIVIVLRMVNFSGVGHIFSALTWRDVLFALFFIVLGFFGMRWYMHEHQKIKRQMKRDYKTAQLRHRQKFEKVVHKLMEVNADATEQMAGFLIDNRQQTIHELRPRVLIQRIIEPSQLPEPIEKQHTPTQTSPIHTTDKISPRRQTTNPSLQAANKRIEPLPDKATKYDDLVGIINQAWHKNPKLTSDDVERKLGCDEQTAMQILTTVIQMNTHKVQDQYTSNLATRSIPILTTEGE